MFEKTIELFDEYYRHIDALGASVYSRDLASEVRQRLEQLTFIISRVQILEGTAQNAFFRHQTAVKNFVENSNAQGIDFTSLPRPPSTQITKDEADTFEKASMKLRILTEAFYYIAGRIRTILRNPEKNLPGLTKFECEGVRNTRNKLIEHAEGNDSRVVSYSFAFGGKCGPVIKAVRYTGQEEIFPDAGLYVNAQAFLISLENQIRSAIAK